MRSRALGAALRGGSGTRAGSAVGPWGGRGALVMWWGSNLPDLVLGIVVSVIAAWGGREILSEANATKEKQGDSPAT